MKITDEENLQTLTAKHNAERYNNIEGNLAGLDCPVCKNKGWLLTVDAEGYEVMKPCACMKARRAKEAIKKSGLSDVIKANTFDSFITDSTNEGMKAKAEAFAENPNGWFYLSGKSGTGKTHLCTAIVGELLRSGKECQYMLWRDEAVALKGEIVTGGYSKRIRKLKEVEVLYIDDFLKGKITEADLNLAFEILNSRYIKRLITIISSEVSLAKVAELDEAIAGRIKERAKSNVLRAGSNIPSWRFK